MTAPDPNLTPGTPVVAIGLEQVYATLLEVRDDVRDMKGELGELSRDSQDHEARIRKIERDELDKLRDEIASIKAKAYAASGALAVIGPVATLVLSRYIGA